MHKGTTFSVSFLHFSFQLKKKGQFYFFIERQYNRAASAACSKQGLLTGKSVSPVPVHFSFSIEKRRSCFFPFVCFRARGFAGQKRLCLHFFFCGLVRVAAHETLGAAAGFPKGSACRCAKRISRSPISLFDGMIFIDGFLKGFHVGFSVLSGGGYTAVSCKNLHDACVGFALEKVGNDALTDF